MQRIISIKDGVTRMPSWRMAEPVNFELCDGEHIAIIGPNGGGKSMFTDIITGSHPIIGNGIKYDFSPSDKTLVSDNIKYIAFKDSYGDKDGTYYLQQRWNQHDISEDTPTAGDLLEEAFLLTGDDTAERRELQSHLYSVFHIEHTLDKYIILLSSGELRKFQLIKTLLSKPRVLIMDNPFIGLDAETRDQLQHLLTTIANDSKLQIILILSRPKDIPPFITHVVEVRNMKVGKKITTEEYRSAMTSSDLQPQFNSEKEERILNLTYNDNTTEGNEVIGMTDICIRYGKRTIIDHFTWNVMKGEHWAVSGRNGAGKSTLLSLVCADNPQAYACNISLFGRKRGTGESIWDIKRRIGYVSPEMHRAYNRDIPAIMVVASGLKDSVGLYTKPNETERDTCRKWMDVFGIEKLADRTFLKLSSGEQRLVLLARAFVKNPELLILDEPFHGLDEPNRLMVTEIIEAFCKHSGKTLIMVSHYPEELPPCIDHKLTLTRTD